jgi:RNA polymerase sigma-70 factor (ECF subfamily)
MDPNVSTQDLSMVGRAMNERSVTAPLDFRAVFEGGFTYVWSTLRRMGVRERDVEDLTHDTFLRVHGRLLDYDPSRPLRPWLFAFAFRVACDYRRLARHRFEVLDDGRDVPHPGPAPDEEASLREGQRLMLRALEEIDLDQRAVFVLHVIDEHSIPDVAAALAIPVNTAYSRLRLAREAFSVAVRRLTRCTSKP